MNKKGFTLAEVLGVIVLLAIIALLAFPTILENIRKSQEKMSEATKKVILASTDTFIDMNQNNYPKTNGSVYCISFLELMNEIEMMDSISDVTDLNTDQVVMVSVENGRYQKEIVDYTACQSKLPYYVDTVLNGTDPELYKGLIPVTITDTGEVKVADRTTAWYDYENKRWANAVTVKDDTYQNASYGTTIPASAITGYFVWIPRYKYMLFNKDGIDMEPTEIQIVFERKSVKKSTGNTNGQYLTHPAFTLGDTELNGIWVGKFETTGTSEKPTILPTQRSLATQNVSSLFATSKKIASLYNISVESRMMKNMEWGAVAYLTQSKYGINGEVRLNNNSNYITGCGASTESAPSAATCQIEYGKATEYPQSTTGNISGIFDMSGGAWDYVMGVMESSAGSGIPMSGNDSINTSGFSGPLTSGNNYTGVSFPNEKYYDLYSYGTTSQDNVAYKRGKLGDATFETLHWNSDFAILIYSEYPWVVRGCSHEYKEKCGIFSFHYAFGVEKPYYASRIVLTLGS